MKKIKFKFSFLTELSNYYFESTVHSVVKCVDGEVIEDNLVSEALENTKTRVQRLTDINALSIAHGNTPITDQKSAECRDLLISLRYSIDGLVRARDSKTYADALILFSWIKKERKFFHRIGKARQVALVNRLVSGMQNDPKVQEALEATDLQERIDKAARLCNDIVELHTARSKDNTQDREEREIIRAECYERLTTLTSALAIKANMEGPDQKKYRAICKTVEEAFKLAHAGHKARITRGAQAGDAPEDDLNEGNINDTTHSNENEPEVIETTDSNVEPDSSGIGNE